MSNTHDRIMNTVRDKAENTTQSTNTTDYAFEFHIPYNYTNTKIEMELKKSYWGEMYSDILNKDFTSLLNILIEMKQMIKDLVPNRKDIHKELDEHIDIPFIKQKLEHDVFDTNEFITLFCYYIHWTIKLGAPKDDIKMNTLREKVILESEEKGHMYILPYAYDTLHTQLTTIHRVSMEYRKQIFTHMGENARSS